jgi:hypothetical protein
MRATRTAAAWASRVASAASASSSRPCTSAATKERFAITEASGLFTSCAMPEESVPSEASRSARASRSFTRRASVTSATTLTAPP